MMAELDDGWLNEGELNEMENIASRQESQEYLHVMERDKQHGV